MREKRGNLDQIRERERSNPVGSQRERKKDDNDSEERVRTGMRDRERDNPMEGHR